MPRLGITYLDVAKTAIKLIEKNIHPSIEEIRKDLGTGSNSTINKHLRLWREKQGNQIEAEKGLPETLLIAVKGLYDAIQSEATHKISTIETESKQKINEVETQLNQMTQQNTMLLQNKVTLENKINVDQLNEIELQKKVNGLEQTIDKKNSENQLLQARLLDKKSEIERLIQQLKHAQHNLEHYRESIKHERDAEKQRYEAQINKLEQQLHQYQKNSIEMQNKISVVTQENERLENLKNTLETELKRALKNSRDNELLVQRHEINYSHLSAAQDKLNSEHQTLIEESKHDKNTMHAMEINHQKLLERVTLLENDLKKSEDKMNILSDKNIFLLQEKKEIAYQLEKIQAAKFQ